MLFLFTIGVAALSPLCYYLRSSYSLSLITNLKALSLYHWCYCFFSLPPFVVASLSPVLLFYLPHCCFLFLIAAALYPLRLFCLPHCCPLSPLLLLSLLYFFLSIVIAHFLSLCCSFHCCYLSKFVSSINVSSSYFLLN